MGRIKVIVSLRDRVSGKGKIQVQVKFCVMFGKNVRIKVMLKKG